MKNKVLFLCTGNSCRSQIAEALVNNRLEVTWQAYSAGTDPAGFVHPMALQVLSEIGISHEGISKRIDELNEKDFDIVITVCDDAAENCPLWLGQGKRHHISYPDPAKADGSPEEVLKAFRDMRNKMDTQIINFLKQYGREEQE